MCVDGASRLVMNDPIIQDLMSNPILDVIHKQVAMTLYSLEADHCLHEYEKLLPVYLSLDWAQCSEILDTIEQAGLVVRTEDGIILTNPVTADSEESHCACSR